MIPPDIEFGWDGSSDTQLFPGELTGYRYFRLKGGRLNSVAWTDTIWPARLTASCLQRNFWGGLLRHEEPVPHPACRCGLYGWYTPDEAFENHANGGLGLDDGYPGRLVFGVIAVSGSVVPGTKGFRAEKARVLGVEQPEGQWPPLATLMSQPSAWIDKVKTWAPIQREFRKNYPNVVVASREELIEKFPPQKVPFAVAQPYRVLFRIPQPDALNDTRSALEEMRRSARFIPREQRERSRWVMSRAMKVAFMIDDPLQIRPRLGTTGPGHLDLVDVLFDIPIHIDPRTCDIRLEVRQ